jgi:4-amino-4-deoxy-L-arabinose transferase-like glycosyltransferase
VWITVRLYHQLPHIVDSEAYYFQARMLETGRTWLQAPESVRLLDGFQQVVWNERWFSQYPPGAPALYAAGGLVGLAWLVGPLAGLALVGATALAGLRLFGRSVALAALVLGALSPFVLFQAGSFMSHPIAGAALACSLAAFAYAWCTGRQTWYVVAGVLVGFAFTTREIAGVVYGVTYAAWLLTHRRWRALAWIVAGSLPLLALYLGYNLSITGDALLLPRTLSNPSDRWGFGEVGSYGWHSVAAGLVNTDQNLTLLQFELFGWPPLLALGLMAMPFLIGRATRLDVLLATCAGAFVVAYVGYFYSGIALGPRYYFEAVPALVLLAARGLQACVRTLRAVGLGRLAASSGPCLGVALLCAYSILYYLPHAVDRRMDFGALGNGRRLVLPFVSTTLSGAHLEGVEPPALVLVPNDEVFKTLSALNCPLLDRDHIGDCPVLLIRAGVDTWATLLEQFPGRTVWVIEAHGDLVALDRVHSAPSSIDGS